MAGARLLGASLLLAWTLAGCGTPNDGEFVAREQDFAGFERWVRFDRGEDPVPPSHLGHDVIYIDRLPPAGATSFPIGTRIVRVEETDAGPSTWEIHAMVKRGRGFNPEGARGWELFELAIDARGQPEIEWRGEGPPDGDGYEPPDGGAILGCNHCHGAATYNDSVLSPVLDLSAR